MNIIKDKTIECNILKLIDETRLFISSQLREFTALDPLTGKFKTVPEYPEFSWLEGIVNAVTHREYGMSGRYILVTMFDDRLEIKSPGKLPNIVTVDNIKDTRYARNPRISRVLTDFGWVRELNEGVKRIYSDMADFFLDEPEYSEPEYAVKLTLKNNIVMRNIRQESRLERIITPEIWQQLDELEKRFHEAINDDLNMPLAMGVVWEAVRYDKKSPKIAKLLLKFDTVLGLKIDEEQKQQEVKIPKEILDLVEKRKQARQEKNWEESDRLRDLIKEKGYEVKDTKDGMELIH